MTLGRATQWQHEQRSEGRCPSCGRPNLEVNPKTGKAFWRCASCRTTHAERMSANRLVASVGSKRGRRSDNIPCACGKPMRPTADACFYCNYRAAGWKRSNHRAAKPRVFVSPVPRHVPSGIYLQHDLIAARYQWRGAVCR